MSEELIRAAITVLFGAMAGGLTNSIAIWMLFHPYESPRLGKRPLKMLQGAIPKNQARLAAAIGRTVGTRLLTPRGSGGNLQRRICPAGVSTNTFRGFLDAILNTERGSLRDLIPARMHDQTEQILQEVADFGLARLREHLDSDRFAETLRERAEEIVQAIADEPVAGILTPARESAISEAVEEWLTGAVESEDFSKTIDDYLSRATHRLLEPTPYVRRSAPARARGGGGERHFGVPADCDSPGGIDPGGRRGASQIQNLHS